jgi:o-succinylbenzoate synthase
MLTASFKKHTFIFKQPAGTSRGVLSTKNSWYLIVYDDQNPQVKGIGECSVIEKLSVDDRADFEEKLLEVIGTFNEFKQWINEGLNDFPAIRFGLEMAMLDLQNRGRRILFNSDFVNGKMGQLINGLVWMGDFNFMRKQIIEKIESGYSCIKLKIGALNFDDELNLLRMIRKEFSEKEMELRVDANGAFSVDEAAEKLKRLSEFKLHSIEQPIKQGHWNEMAELCEKSPLPIALDEELIGITDDKTIKLMLNTIKPQFIILKPSLLGGFEQSEKFIRAAKQKNIGWWVTSALEGNIGLNAIAQWTATLGNPMPQGLGTGQLFTNNIDSPLVIQNAQLFYDEKKPWNLKHVFDA